MKIYISADIEGVTGVTHWNETNYNQEGYAAACEQMTAEVSAACRGALHAGATEIWVKDSHGSGRNLIAAKLPQEVRLIRGWTRTPLMMVQELDSTFRAVMFIGYHSRAGLDTNPLSHSFSGEFSFIRINDHYASEFLIATYSAAYFQVPVVFVSGDKGLCDEVAQFNPYIKTIPTKEGRGDATLNYHPDLVVRQIREAVEESLKGDLVKCLLPLPEYFTVDLCFKEHVKAKISSFYPGARQIDPVTVRFETTNYFEVLRMLHFVA